MIRDNLEQQPVRHVGIHYIAVLEVISQTPCLFYDFAQSPNKIQKSMILALLLQSHG
jgi:hypothetical protein